MKRSGTKIAGLGCVIVLLAGLACACGPRESPPTTNENQANEKLINNMIDDFFAYVKIADTKRMPAYFEDSAEAENSISRAYENVGDKAFGEWCGKISAESKVTGIGAKEADVELTVTLRDDAAIMENAAEDGAFADEGNLSDAIHSAPFATKKITVKVVKDEHQAPEKDTVESLHLLWMSDRVALARFIEYRLRQIDGQLALIERNLYTKRNILEDFKRAFMEGIPRWRTSNPYGAALQRWLDNSRAATTRNSQP